MNYNVAEAVRLLPLLLWDYPELQPPLRGRRLIVRMIRQYAALDDEIHSRVDAGTEVIAAAFEKLSEMPPPPKPLCRGPVLYVAASTLLGGVASIPFLVQQNPFGFLMIMVGGFAGGLVYRVRARHWPRNPAVRGQQATLAWLIVLFVPGLLVISRDPSPAGAVVGSFICGLLASGIRRDQAAIPKADAAKKLTTDEH